MSQYVVTVGEYGDTLETEQFQVVDSNGTKIFAFHDTTFFLFSGSDSVRIQIDSTGRLSIINDSSVTINRSLEVGETFEDKELTYYAPKSYYRGSIAAGNDSYCNAPNSYAHGQYCLASGNLSFASGSRVTASGPGSFARGSQLQATGTGSICIGFNVHSSGTRSFAGGYGRNDTITGSGAYGFTYTYLDGPLTNYEGNAATSSVLIGGYNNQIRALGSYNAIIAGSNNSIDSSITNTSIIAGKNINASLSNTAYSNNLSLTNSIFSGSAEMINFSDTTNIQISKNIYFKNSLGLIQFAGNINNSIQEETTGGLRINANSNIGYSIAGATRLVLSSSLLYPNSDLGIDLGSNLRRFRNLNTGGSIYNGTTELINLTSTSLVSFKTPIAIDANNIIDLDGGNSTEYIQGTGSTIQIRANGSLIWQFSTSSNTSYADIRITGGRDIFSVVDSSGNLGKTGSRWKTVNLAEGIYNDDTLLIHTLKDSIDIYKPVGNVENRCELYDTTANTLTISVADTYTTITGLSIDEYQGGTVTDSSYTPDQAGLYEIEFNAYGTHSQNASDVHISLFVNDVENKKCEGARLIKTANDYGSYSGGAHIRLQGTEELKFRGKSANTGTITNDVLNFRIKRIDD